MSCNPSQGWVKDRFYNRWKEGILPDGMAYIQAKITDNPHIPKDYLESLKMLPRYQYMAFVEGDWDVNIKIGGEFYKCFELDKHVGVTQYNPELPLHISWDDNVNPYLPVAIFQVKGKEIYQIDEITGINPNNTIKAVCNEIIRKYQGHSAGMFVYGDATAQKEDTKLEKGHNFFRLVIDNLAQFRPQLRVLKANPSVVMRGQWINTVLEKELADLKVIIGENCKKTIQDFIGVKEAADGTKNKEKETDPKTKVSYQKYSHLSDCFVGETLVLTDKGQVRIDKLNVGDLVMTRKGYKPVVKIYDKGEKEVFVYQIGNHKLVCTPDHKVWTKENNFKPIGHLFKSNTFCIFDENKKIWKEKKLSITVSDFTDTQTQKIGQKEFIIRDMQKLMVWVEKLDCTFTNIFMRLVKYQPAHTFITKMKTRLITLSKTLNVSHRQHINHNTWLVNIEKKCQEICYLFMQDQKHLNGINQKLEENGILSKAKKILKSTNPFVFARSVKMNLSGLLAFPTILNFAVENASQDTICELTEQKANGMKVEAANIAQNNFLHTNGEKQKPVQKVVRQVYDIQVADEHEFFANGVLVHNCFDYFLCSAFAAEFANYQKGGVIQSIGYGRNIPSKNSY